MRQVAITSSVLLLLLSVTAPVLAEQRQGVPGRRVGGGTRLHQETRSASWCNIFLPTPGMASTSDSDRNG
jgi:hypothetical protein